MTRLVALDRLLDFRSQTGELRDELERIDQLATTGAFEDLAESLLQLANDFHYAGRPHFVLAAVEDLRTLVPSHRLSAATDAWAMNYEALASSALGNEALSGQILERMLARGRELNDAQIVSTALQNLGARALIAGDTEDAVRLGVEAYQMKRQLNDDFGGAQILLNLAAALKTRGLLEDAERILTDFSPLIALGGTWGLRASLYGNLGQLQSLRGDFDAAEKSFREALRAARLDHDSSKEVIALQNLGSLAMDRRKPGHALRWYRKALRVAEEVDAPPLLELVYRSMARALHETGRDGEAAEALKSAVASATRLADPLLRAGAMADLAALRVSHGEMKEARAMFEEVVRILEAADDMPQLVSALRNLAVLETQLGQTTEAITHVDQALNMSAGADRDLRSDLYDVAAQAALAVGDIDSAVDYFNRDIEEARRLDARGALGRELQAATALRNAGLSAASLPFYEDATSSARALEDESAEFDARNDRATALSEIGHQDAAADEFASLLEFARRHANRVMEQQVLYNLGEVRRRAGDTSTAIGHAEEALRLARELSDSRAETESLCNLGLALADAERFSESKRIYRDAERVAKRLGETRLQARAVGGRARVAFLQRRYSQSVDLYDRAAALSSADDGEHLEDLAGLLESLSASGQMERVQEVAQDLVNVAQRWHDEGTAVVALARSASQWLGRGAVEEAANLFAVSIVLGAVAAEINFKPAVDEPPITSEGAYSLLMPMMLLVTYTEQEPGSPSRAFYDRVFNVLNARYEGIGEHLRFVLETAVDAYHTQSTGSDEG